ncbi:MucBP domain-containing protein [Culicoidibacter larvae]|uniref:MucBP domain-containing protein n=1 Tax=Culicoidibacter larvae TaxID=2579976 RepID=UPI001484D43A|nr:MucBP domain-containing protein [Culicoidibacter larvae]
MKKIMITTIFVLSLGFMTLFNTTSVFAGGSSHGAVIEGIETSAEYGHVLDYNNTNEVLERINYISYIRDWNAGSYKFYTMSPDNGTQLIKKGTLRLETGVGNTATSLADIYSAYGVNIKLYVTSDGTTFSEVTGELDAKGYYANDVDLKGYYVEYEMTRDTILDLSVALYVTHEIRIDYDKLTPAQKAGTEGLAQWLDSKSANAAATPNYQRIFIVNPEISGTVKYQQLADQADMPVWDQATVIADVPVDLLRADGSIIASTKTDANGRFVFSNQLDNATGFNLANSSEQLYISIDGQGMKEWQVVAGTSVVLTDDLALGTIIDVSKSQTDFDFAMSKTDWKSGYTNHDLKGENALGSQFILTNFEKAQDVSTVTAHYLDESGNILADAKKMSGPVNAAYQTEKLDIDGYEFKMMDPLSAAVSGTFKQNHQDVIYIYTKVPGTNVLPETGSGYVEGVLGGMLFLISGSAYVIINSKRK